MPLIEAICESSYETIKQIIALDRKSVNRLGYQERSPAHVAACRNRKKVLSLLIKCDAKMQEDAHGTTPLHQACYSGSESCARLLMETDNVDLDVQDSQKNTPLLLSLYIYFHF